MTLCSGRTLLLFTLIFSNVSSFPQFSYISNHEKDSLNPANGEFLQKDRAHFWTLNNVTRLDDSTDEVNIAYFIQVSLSSLPMVDRLMSKIHHKENFYALHFDKKIPAYKVISIVSHIKSNPLYSNVHVMERESVTYRGITMVLNNMAAISQLLSLGQWDYCINLSGSDYPLVAPEVQRKLLALPFIKERESNFFIFAPREEWEDSKRYRFDQIAVDTALGFSNAQEDSELIITGEQTPLKDKLNFDFIKGEGWFILTRKACKFMLDSPFSRKMLLSMAYSQDASEHFYISLFWNHPEFNRTIVPHALRTVFWRLNGVSSGQHPFLIDETRETNGSYSLWPYLRVSPHFFARKFKNPDNPVMDMIDKEMSGMSEASNEEYVKASTLRAEQFLHWLYEIFPEEPSNEVIQQNEDKWPSRR